MKKYFYSITGKILFVHERIGKQGKPFRMYKIRTMYPGAEADGRQYSHLNEANGPVFKIRDDPRFTKIGKWLARSGLDELPQIINIFRGEMAIVGPRPLPTNEEAQIPEPIRSQRQSVKPGLTSSWVVEGSHSLSFCRWMELDIRDIERKSFLYDCVIVVRTLLLVTKNLLYSRRR